MRQIVFVALALLAATSASALKPATESFLIELGIDPNSSQITTIASDSITTKAGVVKTLDSLCAKRDESGVRQFVTTRNFVRAFMRDSSTPFPDREVYNTAMLKPDEVTYILNKLKEPFRLA